PSWASPRVSGYPGESTPALKEEGSFPIANRCCPPDQAAIDQIHPLKTRRMARGDQSKRKPKMSNMPVLVRRAHQRTRNAMLHHLSISATKMGTSSTLRLPSNRPQTISMSPVDNRQDVCLRRHAVTVAYGHVAHGGTEAVFLPHLLQTPRSCIFILS
ncbi:hypothetical protein PTTG_29110, partial [Puccinia triticina 1-1 BBBD Race 1]